MKEEAARGRAPRVYGQLQCMMARWSEIAQHLDLSRRQSDVARQLFLGKREVQLAEELRISVHTIHTHIRILYGKLAVSNRVGLLLLLFETYLSLDAVVPEQKSGSQAVIAR